MAKARAELDAFASKSEYLAGHNLLGQDLPAPRAVAPLLKLLKRPVVDSLYLSPLAFPENPYHRLVKDYKLVRDAVNDLVADAPLSARNPSDSAARRRPLQPSHNSLAPGGIRGTFPQP